MKMTRFRLIILIYASIFILGTLTKLAWNNWTHYKLENAQYSPPHSGMALVPAGYFFMGSNEANAEDDERPLREVFVKGFYIDKYEITNAQYKEVNPSHQYTSGDEELPVTGVFRDEAAEFCDCKGKRLPTGEEWEKAARGIDGRIYPWGNSFRIGMANCRVSPKDSLQLLPVGSFPEGTSPYGCYDMGGNAWEWVSDDYIVGSFFGFTRPDTVRGIVRGGAFRYSPFQCRVSHQGFEDPELTCNDIGFRCVKDAVILK